MSLPLKTSILWPLSAPRSSSQTGDTEITGGLRSAPEYLCPVLYIDPALSTDFNLRVGRMGVGRSLLLAW